jgi:hypothetical protein
VRILPVLLLAACATGTRVEQAPDASNPGDGSTTQADAAPGPIDAPDPTPSGAALLVTEVALAPSTGEFIEISNPTGQTIDLSTYYLADSGAYFRLPAGVPAVDANDFIVKFPAGATIAPGAVVTIALDTAASFQTIYGVAPTFSVASSTMTSVAANGLATLTNGGELVVMFEWSGQVDLVRDVDLVLAGVPSVANGLVDKSAQAFDGPDSDSSPSAYGADARTIASQPTAPGAGVSTKRVALEAGHETQTGTGNGIAGDDETSENTASTWDTTFTAPTPGTVPTALLQ